MSKRLLLISSNSSSRGGGERYLVYLTQGLHLLGCEVHILLSTVGYMDSWVNTFTAEGAHVHRKNLLGLRHRPLRFLQSMLDKKQQLEVAKACQAIAPDAILVNQQYDEDGLDYITGALISNVAPVGGIIHMPMTAEKYKRPFGQFRGRLLHRWYEKHPYSLIFVSKGSKKEFENCYTTPHPSHVVNHGCIFPDITVCSPSIPANWDKSLPIIGFAGQFVAQKNLQLLVEAWLWTRKNGVDSRLLLIGDGPERGAIEKRLQNAAPQNTWFITGWQEYPETYLPVLDIYAMTSHFEGLPLALIEAVGRGLPAVLTNFNGAADVAEYGPWVNIATDATPEFVGAALMASINNLTLLKQQARDGQKAFREYFSLERMARETIETLGIA